MKKAINKPKTSNAAIWIFVLITVAILSLTFYRNQFGVANNEWFMTYQDDSDLHIRGRIARTIEKGTPFSDFGLVGQQAEIDGVVKYDPYFRQIGIQGIYASIVQQITGAGLDDTVRYTRMLNAFLMAIICTVFAAWCYCEFGIVCGIISVVLFIFSPWLTVSARNLYWATWLMFLPAVIMLLLLKNDEKNNKYSNILAFFLMLCTVFLKCGCGYEFVSCVLVCMELPLIYYAIKNKWGVKKFFTRTVITGVGGICGFAAALAVNILQCKMLVGNFSEAIKLMVENISKRTGAFGIEQTNDLIRASLEVSPLLVINTYLLSGEPVLFGFTMSDIIVFFLFSLCLFIATGKGSKSAYISAAVSIAGPLSWLILAKGHSYIHCHINYILWSIPTIYLMVLSGMGTLTELFAERYKSAKTSRQRLLLLAIPALLLGYILISFYNKGFVRGW